MPFGGLKITWKDPIRIQTYYNFNGMCQLYIGNDALCGRVGCVDTIRLVPTAYAYNTDFKVRRLWYKLDKITEIEE